MEYRLKERIGDYRTTVDYKLFFHTLWYDAVFYTGAALLLLAYQFVIEALTSRALGITISVLLIVALIMLWLWNTALLLRTFGKRKCKIGVWAKRTIPLFLGMGSSVVLLIVVANGTMNWMLTGLVENHVPLMVSSLAVSVILLGGVIPLFVISTAVLHTKTMSWFFNEKKIIRHKIRACIIVFSCITIIALALKFFSEDIELILSGVLLIMYFAWQKAYLSK